MFYGYVTLSAICNLDGEKANAVNLGYGLFLVRIEIFGIYVVYSFENFGILLQKHTKNN